MAKQFYLEPHEAQTALWKKLKSHYEEQLDLMRKQNDGALDDIQTAMIRGRIAEVKKFLALDKPPPGNKVGDSQEPPIEY